MEYMDSILTANASSDAFLAIGYCDICIQGLTSGTVKFQYLLKPTALLPSPTWKDIPDASYTSDTFETLFVSEHGIKVRWTGVSNNVGVYVRVSRHNNK